MSDKYGYIGIETLLNFCSNQKDHCITPNDFMRMNRVKIDARPHGKWINEDYGIGKCWATCSECRESTNGEAQDHGFGYDYSFPNFCPNCGADMREGEAE